MSRLIDKDKVVKVIENSLLETGVKQSLVTKLVQIPTVDQWHYPGKGEYPTDDRRVLCKLRGADNWYECDGYDKDDDTWGFEGFIACGSEVVRWQYIEPPKEEA